MHHLPPYVLTEIPSSACTSTHTYPQISVLVDTSLHTVPGVMGSQLEVKDNGGPSKCETAEKQKKLWIEPFRLLFNTACAKRELP